MHVIQSISLYKICLIAFINAHTPTNANYCCSWSTARECVAGREVVAGDCDLVSHTSVLPKSKWNYFAICDMNCIYSLVCACVRVHAWALARKLPICPICLRRSIHPTLHCKNKQPHTQSWRAYVIAMVL